MTIPTALLILIALALAWAILGMMIWFSEEEDNLE